MATLRAETLPAETATVTAGNGAGAPSKPGAFAAGLFDRRTRQWRRLCELIDLYTLALGGSEAVDPVLEVKVESAAEMRVIAELARARHLSSAGDVTLDDVVRVERQAERAERAIEARQAKPAGPTLADYIADKGEAT